MAPVPVQSWRRDVLNADLGTAGKAVALALSVYVNGQGEGYPSRATLAAAASVSVRTVDRAIERLERLDLVVVRRGRGRTHTNRYRLRMPAVKGDAHVPFSGLAALGITLGITRERATLATVKGDTGDTRSRKEIEALSRTPARTRARAEGGSLDPTVENPVSKGQES